YICQHVEHPVFFLFSDDADFVKKEFSFLNESHVIANNSGENSFRDLQLMSLCHHNIIANSTFSQWGALLNVNKDHITIYPKQYMIQKDNEEKSLKNWVQL
ncbi:MAG: alpha-1,2-fucosyltransferase, partial [Clostridia bacterium]|nr:alpha-1,2-fucosyltransferase [Clostridia bacterium]